MSFNAQEQAILTYGVQNGKSQEEIERAIAQYRSGIKPSELQKLTPSLERPPEQPSFLDSINEDMTKRADKVGATIADPTIGVAHKALNVFGQGVGMSANILEQGAMQVPVLKQVLGGMSKGFEWLADSPSSPVKMWVDANANNFGMGGTSHGEALLEEVTGLYDSDTQFRDTVDATANIARLGMDIDSIVQAPSFVRNVTNKITSMSAVKPSVAPSPTTQVAPSIAPNPAPMPPPVPVSPASPLLAGASQVVRSLAERIPTALGRGEKALTEAAQTAETLKTATPAESQAIKSKVPEKIVGGVKLADDATLDAMSSTLDTAQALESGTLGSTSSVFESAGKTVAEMYKVLVDSKKAIGAQIGDIVDELARVRKAVNMSAPLQQLSDVLQWNRIFEDGKGGLTFRSQKFTPAEMKLIEELYRKATSLGNKMTATDIYEINQFFSKLKRTAKFDGVGEIMVEMGDGTAHSLFDVFKRIFNDKLEQMNPKLIELNKQYAEASSLQGDVRNSLLKGGKFRNLASAAEQARVNLRRLFGEAQSQPTYLKITQALDRYARDRGYTGANAAVLTDFALEVQKMFPNSIKGASFTGGIQTGTSGIMRLLEKTMEIGAPNLTDQQVALRNLINELLEKRGMKATPASNPAPKAPPRNPKKADPVFRAPKGTPKTPEIAKVEKAIKENVAQQKIEVAKKNYAVVAKLKEVYDTLVAQLKALVKKVKDTPNKSGGMINFGADVVKKGDSLEAQAKNYKTAEEFVKAQTNAYHSGTADIQVVDTGKSNFSKTFYLSDKADYAKSFGGKGASLNEMTLDPKANLADMRKPSPKLVSQIVEKIKANEANNKPYSDKNFSFYPYSTTDVINGISQGKAHFAELPQVKEILKVLGYDGQITAEVPYAKNIGVWNKDIVKTSSQLTDIWKKANTASPKTHLVKAQDALRKLKGYSASDIMAKYPDLNLKREVKITEVDGSKSTIDAGEALTPYELKGNKVLLQDGETYIVSKNQFANIKGNAVSGEAKEFAPELTGTEETVMGSRTQDFANAESEYNQLVVDLKKKYDPTGRFNMSMIHDEMSTADKAKFDSAKKKTELARNQDTKFSSYTLPDGKNYKETIHKVKSHPVEPDPSHFDDAASWHRSNERTINGKKVYFLEEVQKGKHLDKTEGHPFGKGKYIKIEVKSALMEAVDAGADEFVWINGEQTSARYNLAKELKEVSWKPHKLASGEDVKTVSLMTKDVGEVPINISKDGTIVGGGRNFPSDWKGKKIDEAIGKGLADSIMSKESGTLAGEGLKFGGEWANTLYDKQVKNIVEDVTGGKVEMMDLGLPVDKKANGSFTFSDTENKRFGIDLRPENLKVGMEIINEGTDPYIVTEILDKKGQFKAIPKQMWDKFNPRVDHSRMAEMKIVNFAKSFDISTKTTMQQGIRITDAIRAKILGEAPTLKKPSGKSPL